MQDNPQQQSNSIAGPTGAAALAQAEFVMGLLGRPTIALFRHSFGQRYFGGTGILGKVVLFGPLLWMAFNALGERGGEPFGLFLLTSFAACLYHHLVMWLRKRNGERWHSRYSGTPFLAYVLPLDPQIIRRWVEPAIGFTLAGFVAPLSPPLAGWLMLSSACIGATETIAESRWRTILMDAQDKEIEATHFRDALNQKAPKETEGFVIPVGNLTQKQRGNLLSSLTRMYDGARDRITEVAQTVGAAVSFPTTAPPLATAGTFPAPPLFENRPPAALVCMGCKTRNPINAGFCHHCGVVLRVASA